MRVPSRRGPVTTSLTFRLRLLAVIRELESACREAADRSWEESDRKRGEEIAFALAEACRLEGLRDPAILARSLGSLMRLTQDQIQPIEEAYREKIREVLASLQTSAVGILTKSGCG